MSSRYSGGVSDFRTGNGADWLDLIATLIGRYRRQQVEFLTGPAELRSWLAEHGLEPRAAPGPADVEATRSLREALHRAAKAVLDGQPIAPDDVRIVQRALDADEPLRLGQHGAELRPERPADTTSALARLTRQAALDLTGPARTRLRACGDDTCAGIFLDHSGRRRWCADERCGVRVRVRAHRARSAARE